MIKSTKDIYLAACWLALGAKLERTDKADRRHMEFHFSSHEFSSQILNGASLDLNKIETDWANGCVMVNAVQYKDALQRMKAVIHSD